MICSSVGGKTVSLIKWQSVCSLRVDGRNFKANNDRRQFSAYIMTLTATSLRA